MKLARALNPRATHGNTLVMRRSPACEAPPPGRKASLGSGVTCQRSCIICACSRSGDSAIIQHMPHRPIGGFGPNWPVFVHLAAEARDAAIQVEEADSRAWPMRDALSAILFSALATEAFINELPEAAFRDAYALRSLQLPAEPVLDDLAT